MVEGYVNWDALGLLQQLGVVPPLAIKEQSAARVQAAVAVAR
jgi:hypothetical protein